GGDRGGRGRGRRGRRRRNGPGGGIPESKFYSPRRGDSEPVGEPVATREREEPVEASDEEFPVLPGESLAKYSVNEVREDVRDEEAEEPEAFCESPVAEVAAAEENDE